MLIRCFMQVASSLDLYCPYHLSFTEHETQRYEADLSCPLLYGKVTQLTCPSFGIGQDLLQSLLQFVCSLSLQMELTLQVFQLQVLRKRSQEDST